MSGGLSAGEPTSGSPAGAAPGPLSRRRPDPALIDALLARLGGRGPRVLLVTGVGGIGKSAVLAALAERLAVDAVPLLRVAGIAGLEAVPLAAFAPALAALPLALSDEAASPAERLQALYAAVAPARTRHVLVVDDASSLDAVSAATVAQLVKVYGLRAIVSVRDEADLPAPLAALVDEGYVDRAELGPLDDADAAALVEETAGPQDPETVRRLVGRSGGVPLYLRELVAQLPDLDGIPPRIRRTVEARLALLPPSALDALEQRAVAGEWPGDLAPVVREIVLERMGPAEADARRIAAAQRLAHGDEASRHRATAVLAMSSRPPSVAAIAAAAQHHYLHSDHEQALRLAAIADRLAGERGEPRPAGALAIRGASLSDTGRLDEADDAFAEAIREAASDADLALAATRAGAHYAVRRQRPDLAAELIESVLPRVEGADARRMLQTEVAKWRWRDRGEWVPADDAEPENAALAVNVLLLTIQASVFAGRLDRTRSAVARLRELPLPDDRSLRHVPQLVDFGEWLSVLLTGGDGAGYAAARRQGRFDEAAGMWTYALALHAFLAGDLDGALRQAGEAVELLAWRDFVGAAGPARALRATAAAAMGRRALAHETLADIDPLARHNILTRFQVAEAEAWLLRRAGELDRAAAVIADAVPAEALPTHGTFAAITLHTAVRFGRPGPVHDALHAARREAPGIPVVEAIVAHADAARAADANVLIAAARALAEVGLRAGAADAARQAAAVARAQSAPSTARRATALATRIAADRPLPDATADAGLSDRERQIATLAAARHRNREIAQRLGLSVRTVENHLASAYRKLGAAGRDELAAHLGSGVLPQP